MSDSVRPHRRQPTRLRCPGILQARTLEWVAISFSSAWKWKVKVKLLSRVWLFVTPWTAAFQAPLSMGFSRQEYWSGVPLPSPLFMLSSAEMWLPVFDWSSLCCLPLKSVQHEIRLDSDGMCTAVKRQGSKNELSPWPQRIPSDTRDFGASYFLLNELDGLWMFFSAPNVK